MSVASRFDLFKQLLEAAAAFRPSLPQVWNKGGDDARPLISLGPFRERICPGVFARRAEVEQIEGFSRDFDDCG